MDYGKILSKAWQIIWKYKILWLFGFLANCGGNSTSTSNNNSGGTDINFSFDSGNPGNIPPGMLEFLNNMERFFERNADQIVLWVILLSIAILILALIAFFVRVYGETGLVRGILKADGDTPEKLSFGEIHDEVKPFFWRLVGFQLLIFVVSLVLVLILVVPFVLATVATMGIAMLCLIPLLCLTIPVGWAVSVIIKQATIAMLVEDLDIGAAFKRGWEVVRDNPVEYLVMALILMVGSFILTIVIALPQLLAIAPMLAPMMNGMITDNWEGIMNGIWVAVACLVAYWPVQALLTGILRSYVESAWVLTFLENTGSRELPERVPELPQPPTTELENA